MRLICQMVHQTFLQNCCRKPMVCICNLRSQWCVSVIWGLRRQRQEDPRWGLSGLHRENESKEQTDKQTQKVTACQWLSCFVMPCFLSHVLDDSVPVLKCHRVGQPWSVRRKEGEKVLLSPRKGHAPSDLAARTGEALDFRRRKTLEMEHVEFPKANGEASSFSVSSLILVLVSHSLLLWDAGEQRKRRLCLNKEPAFLFSAGRLSFRNMYCTVPWPQENKMGLACFQCGCSCGLRESCLKVYFRDKITQCHTSPTMLWHSLMDYSVFPSVTVTLNGLQKSLVSYNRLYSLSDRGSRENQQTVKSNSSLDS